MSKKHVAKTEAKSNQPQAASPPRMAYTMRETAAILGVEYQTVYRLCKRGLLRSSTALRTKLFPVSEIERFLNSTLP